MKLTLKHVRIPPKVVADLAGVPILDGVASEAADLNSETFVDAYYSAPLSSLFF